MGVLHLIYKRGCLPVGLSRRLSDGYQRINYRADWAQPAYRCKVWPDDGFRLSPIPIGR